jgi:hypothetical protein
VSERQGKPSRTRKATEAAADPEPAADPEAAADPETAADPQPNFSSIPQILTLAMVDSNPAPKKKNPPTGPAPTSRGTKKLKQDQTPTSTGNNMHQQETTTQENIICHHFQLFILSSKNYIFTRRN